MGKWQEMVIEHECYAIDHYYGLLKTDVTRQNSEQYTAQERQFFFILLTLNFEYAAWKKCILSFWGDCIYIYVNLSHFVRHDLDYFGARYSIFWYQPRYHHTKLVEFTWFIRWISIIKHSLLTELLVDIYSVLVEMQLCQFSLLCVALFAWL